jgi:hypothetical protein
MGLKRQIGGPFRKHVMPRWRGSRNKSNAAIKVIVWPPHGVSCASKGHKDNPNAPVNFLIIFILTKSPSTNLIVVVVVVVVVI